MWHETFCETIFHRPEESFIVDFKTLIWKELNKLIRIFKKIRFYLNHKQNRELLQF